MKRLLKWAGSGLLILALIPCLSGCVTYAVLTQIGNEMAQNAVQPGNETGVEGERADYRATIVGFARENIALLDSMIDAFEHLEPRPSSVRAEYWASAGIRLIASYPWRNEVQVSNAMLRDAFSRTPLCKITAYDGGWLFDTDYSSGMLDVGSYYELLYRAADPLAGYAWEALGDGWTSSKSAPGSETYYYIEPIADGLYYSYTGWF